jgi:hypothetical protein
VAVLSKGVAVLLLSGFGITMCVDMVEVKAGGVESCGFSIGECGSELWRGVEVLTKSVSVL